jgi:L-serine kinase (ADP)
VSERPVFRLVPISELKEHEEVDPRKVDELVEDIRRSQSVGDPVWVALGSGVILNGHHRVAALRRLGAKRVPAWMVDYHSPEVRLDRWSAGPPIAKAEVEGRALRGELFPPKTTRHRVDPPLPSRRTPLADLLGPGGPDDQSSASRASPRRGAPASETT